MASTDYIVTIDLGTSHLVGMIGKKNAKGTLSIEAEEVEESASCIQRGRIHNVGETARRIKRLILELQNKVPNSRIDKAYIGIGGQSLRSLDHSEVRTINADAFVQEEDIRILDEQCKNYHPDMLDVLAIVPPIYYLDDKRTSNPVGIPCKRIEARYKLIVGQPIIRKSIITSIENQANINIAGIIVSPLALAEAVLSPNEKELGCAMINFGAGVTSLVVYKNGSLVHLSIIPLGGNLITRDLTSLHLVESEAERLKTTYGSAMSSARLDKTKSQFKVKLGATEGSGMREIEVSEIDTVVEARAKEIIENVYARLDENQLSADVLGAGIVLTGGGSNLENLSDLVRDRFKLDVRSAIIRKGFIEDENNMVGDPQFMTAISLLLQGRENCIEVTHKETEPIQKPVAPIVEEEEDEESKEEERIRKEKEEKERKKKEKKRKDGGLFGNLSKVAKGLFDED